MNHTQVNPKFKDSLFRLVFRGKEELLSLYNAVNGSNYQNPEDLVINTLEDVVYMGMKNDVSFLFADILSLYEHQSTFNPNIPLRGIFYHSRVLRNYVEEMGLDIYSRKQLVLPMPVFMVFYNGTEHQEDRRVLKLSDLFSKPTADFPFPPALECTAIMLNINYGHNKELMERCKKLEEYAFFVDQVRKLRSQGLSLEAAADEAIRISLEQGVLTDILRKNRAEVKDLILTEYNEELHIKNEKNISYEEGVQTGLLLGRQKGRQEGRLEERQATREEDILIFISAFLEIGQKDTQILKMLTDKFQLSEAEAAKYLSDYHKAHPQ